MIKTLIFFAVLLGIAFGGSWLADRPGQIIIQWPWLDTGFEVSLLFGALMVIAAMGVAIALWVFVRSIWKSPGAIGGFFSGRRRDKGYKALSTGMIAVGVGDLALAKKHAAKARKLIGDEPMTLMLEAQTAQMAGDATKARQSFEAMLDQDETRALGRRGLYIEAQRRGDADEAMEMAKAATDEGKKTPGWAGTALFDMQTASEDWQGALITLSQNHSNKHVSKEQFRRQRAVLLTAQAFALEGEDNADVRMRPLLLEACKLAPGLVPAATKAADILNELKEYRKASKLIEAAWREEPHPELAMSYAYIKTGDTAVDRLKRIRSLYALMPDHLESKIAMARACLDAREWAEARNLIEPLAQSHLTPRLCMLMAELEEGESHDFGLVRQWLARAVGAHRDPAWTADGQVSDTWQPTSPLTGKLDVFEWKVPVREIAHAFQPILESSELDSDRKSNDDDLLLLPSKDDAEDMVDITDGPKVEAEAAGVVADAEPDVEPASEPATEPAEKPEILEAAAAPSATNSQDETVSDASLTDVDSTDTVDAETIKVASESSEHGKDAVPEKEKTAEGIKSKPKKVEFPMPHAPDDPGPKGDPVPPTPEKRFRLF
ncbi:heme biosynthesis HemY N-terminal domain-containing protein [Cohaesibacter celericrescens]|uniref:heme biosynthesis HemY N-terminal domain-containing protein n=1 Tax=Cohaesibacter celericrescens TaxID=2067669 RepID=UPI003568235D